MNQQTRRVTQTSLHMRSRSATSCSVKRLMQTVGQAEPVAYTKVDCSGYTRLSEHVRHESDRWNDLRSRIAIFVLLQKKKTVPLPFLLD